MKILGILRGFPGLGRVVSGVSIIETLRDFYGCDTEIITYLQGKKYLENRGYEQTQDVTSVDYCSIGLLPTNTMGEYIFKRINAFNPDIVLVDGEPLIIYSLKTSYPQIKVVTLLNPSDVDNSQNSREAMAFFNSMYSMADLAIVHGLRHVEPDLKYKKLISINTILRNEIFKVVNNPSNDIYCVLGGGTVNVGKQFADTTIAIASLCREAAKALPEYNMHIVCSSCNIYDALKDESEVPNVILHEKIEDATEYYSKACLIITRSGRNTLSELAYLGIPSISFITGCQYRRAEQEENLRSLHCQNIIQAETSISSFDLACLARKMIKIGRLNGGMDVGNIHAIKKILSLYSFNLRNGWNYKEWLKEMDHASSLDDQLARKIKTKQLRANVFQANVDIVKSGYYRNNNGDRVDVSAPNSYSMFYHEPIVMDSSETIHETQNIEIVNDDSINAAENLISKGYNPAVLNMACEDGPGGGVIGGCYGQEESLFRRTDLYRYMFQYSKHASDYELIKSGLQYPLDKRFGGVYVHDALVIREVESSGYKLKDKPSRVSFIAVPALRDPILTEDGILNKEDAGITRDKIRTIFRIGISNGHDSLVLGAWGCGIFHNPPHYIALLFNEILNEAEFKGRFKQITFAILEDQCSHLAHNPKGNFKPFYEVFHG